MLRCIKAIVLLGVFGVYAAPAADAAAYRVFTTSASYNGNLGGLSGADAKCAAAATSAGLGGDWVAFLSDSGTNVKERIGPGPFARLDGLTVATSVADLFDESIENPMGLDENGATVAGRAWTGTDHDGTTLTELLCSDWATPSATPRGRTGKPDAVNKAWVSYYGYHCNEQHHLYCFEVGDCAGIAEGGDCDDGDPSTRCDVCEAGICKGVAPFSSSMAGSTKVSVPDLQPGVANEPVMTHLDLVAEADLPDRDQLPDDASFPVGAITVTLKNVPAGGSVTVTAELPMEIDGGLRLYKHMGAAGWADVTDRPEVTFQPGQARYQIALTDGGFGDADGVANGVIRDPMGPVRVPAAIPALGQWAMILSLLVLVGLAFAWLRRRSAPAA
jgi:hypothetical protein